MNGLDKSEAILSEKIGHDLSLSDTNNHEVGQVEILGNADELERRLGNRQIQLIAIGGAIGTGLFVSIGAGLAAGGPIGLLLAFITYCVFVGLVNNCMSELMVLYPVSGGFIRLAGHFVDDAFGLMAGWNFFIYEALVIPFEMSALAIVVQFWNNDAPVWAVVLATFILYAIINALLVSAYGEAEFWLSSGKVILLLSLFCFTFITMCGGNPKGDAYGFRYWVDPGPFNTFRSTGSLGRWEGFLAAMWNASFSIVGPEYLSMIAGEAKRPRIYIKAAYKTIYWRFGLFFIGGALCCGIVVSSKDPTLLSILRGNTSGSGTAAASPYVIAMHNLGVHVYPDIVNALLVTSIFSAGNTYVYCATRSLYGLALEGRAPAIFKKCTKWGVPIYSLALTMAFSLLAFLQASPSAATALGVLVGLVTAAAFLNYVIMSVTYVFYYRATVAQGLDRRSLPYYGYFQPYCGYISVVFFSLVVAVYGYTTYKPFSVLGYFSAYAMVFVAIVTFFSWKIFKRTKFIKPAEADLVWERPIIDAYEAAIIAPPTSFWLELVQMFGIRRQKGGDVKFEEGVRPSKRASVS